MHCPLDVDFVSENPARCHVPDTVQPLRWRIPIEDHFVALLPVCMQNFPHLLDVDLSGPMELLTVQQLHFLASLFVLAPHILPQLGMTGVALWKAMS